MPDNLDLSLPQRESRQKSKGHGALAAAVAVLLLVGLANLAVSWRATSRPTSAGKEALGAQAMKDLALKLEKQGLHEPATRAWGEYLEAAGLTREGQARIWYRIGKLHQESGDFERALGAFYRSESLAKLDELAPEITRLGQKCLEALGKFAALRYERADRVEMGRGAGVGDEVVAEIGPERITASELDRRIEKQIELQMAQFAPYLDPDQLSRRKEEMLKRFSSSGQRLQLLQQFVAEELLYRKAREDKLYEDSATRALLADAERGILAQTVLQHEIADKVRIDESDLKLYYDANREQYRQPERAEISHILVGDEAAAAEVHRRLDAGDSFEELARELSADAATAGQGGAIAGWIEKGKPAPGIGPSEELESAVFLTESGQVVGAPVKTDRGWHVILVRSRESERQKPFDEVRGQVHGQMRAQKERQVQEDLIERLRERYDVVIHQSRFQPAGEAEQDAQ